MTDIVERREIARLERECARLEGLNNSLVDLLRLKDAEIERLQAWQDWQRGEIERLRRDLEIWRRNGGDILREAEIERLRNESHADEQRYQEAKAEIEQLKAKIDILRQHL